MGYIMVDTDAYNNLVHLVNILAERNFELECKMTSSFPK